MAFLCLTNGSDGTPEVAILHRILRCFVDTPGDEPSGFHDRVTGLLGDIMPRQYPAVEVPGSTFHLIGTPTRLPTVDAMEALIPTWEHPNVPLGPYTDMDPDTETCRPRNTQLIPGKYVAIIIHMITTGSSRSRLIRKLRAQLGPMMALLQVVRMS